MGVAVLTIVVSVLAGTLLALWPQKNAGWMGPLRTFGFAAALSVALLHMVPESIEAIGGWAVLALGLGLVLPALLGNLGSALWRAGHASAEPRHLELEAGYAGLLVHKVGDGLALGVYAGDLHRTGAAHGFAAALAAHIVPVVAIVVLTFDSVRGRGSALLRALGLALAGLLGVFLTRSVALGDMAVAQGWLSAIAAGMLLHVVAHDLHVDLPQTPLARGVDAVVAFLGLLVSVWGGEAHGAHDEGAPAVASLLDTLAKWALPVTALLVLGCFVGAACALFAQSRPPSTRLRRLTVRLSSMFAPEAVICSLGLVTMGFGLIHSIFALLLAAVLAPAHEALPDERQPDDAPKGLPRYLAAVDARLLGAGGSTLVGVVLAALVQTSLGGPVATGSGLQELVWITVVAVPGYFCAPAAVPVAAVLVNQGLAPGIALAGLLLGPSLAGVGGTLVKAGRVWRPLARLFALSIPVWAGFVASTSIAAFGSGGALHLATGTLGQILGTLAGLLVLRVAFRASFRGFLLRAGGRPALRGDDSHHGHVHGAFGAEGPLG